MREKLNRMIRTENLQRMFHTGEVETQALDNMNIEVERGESVAIMGPSGHGKLILLNTLGLLGTPTSGGYYLEGVDVSQYTGAKRVSAHKSTIGFVFQSFNPIEGSNVYENIELPLLYTGVPADQRKQRIEETITQMGIDHHSKHYPRQLSGGQQQRVAITRAVIDHPKLILAGEPTGNLDSRSGKEVIELLTELNKAGTTIIMVTRSSHDAGYVDRIINLFDEEIANGKLQTIHDQLDNTKDFM